MKNNLDILKKETKKLLSKKALRLWDSIEWDKEEVGNSKIGFLSLDPNTTPQRIAKFLNKRAAEVKLFSSEEVQRWWEQMKQKYIQNFPLKEADKFRNELLKKYGNKIISGVSENLTENERLISADFDKLTYIVQKNVPETKKLDDMEFFLRKQQFNLLHKVEQAKKIFWIAFPIILAVLLLLALIKYLLS